VLKGLRLLWEVRADAVEIFGDLMLMVNQLVGVYDCNSDVLSTNHEECLYKSLK
jgi:hypothetical protein